MKLFVSALLVLSTLTSFSQKPIEKTIGEFTELKVYDLIEVEMIKSNENKVIISGKNNEDVLVNNKNGKLKIKMNLESIFNGDDTKVELYYTNVDVIDGNEGSKIHSKDVIKQFELDLKTQEGAEITAVLKTSYANFRAVTGGTIIITGSSKNQDISIYTGGVFNGEEFITERTEVSVNAAGEAYINATVRAEVRVKAGGDVFIYGNPKEVDESRVLGGRIKRM